MCSLSCCNKSNVRSVKEQLFIEWKFLFCTTPWHVSKKIKNSLTILLNSWPTSIDRDGSGTDFGNAGRNFLPPFNPVILKLSSFRLKLGCWTMLRISVAVSTEQAFPTSLKVVASSSTAKDMHHSWLHRAFASVMVFTKGNPEAPNIFVSITYDKTFFVH